MATSIADRVRFDAQGLVPVAITDAETCRLLVLCYMDREALEQTLADGRVHLYRRWDSGAGEWVVDDERCFDPERVYT